MAGEQRWEKGEERGQGVGEKGSMRAEGKPDLQRDL